MPSLKTQCGAGCGLAACPTLGLLVTSDYNCNTLSVWSLPHGPCAFGGAGSAAGARVGRVCSSSPPSHGHNEHGLTLVCTLGGSGSSAPMLFKFISTGYASGCLAFTPPTTVSGGDCSSARPLLLVPDAGHDAVHLVDVLTRTHAGYLASPGSIPGPRGVAATGEVVTWGGGWAAIIVGGWKVQASHHGVPLRSCPR